MIEDNKNRVYLILVAILFLVGEVFIINNFDDLSDVAGSQLDNESNFSRFMVFFSANSLNILSAFILAAILLSIFELLKMIPKEVWIVIGIATAFIAIKVMIYAVFLRK